MAEKKNNIFMVIVSAVIDYGNVWAEKAFFQVTYIVHNFVLGL